MRTCNIRTTGFSRREIIIGDCSWIWQPVLNRTRTVSRGQDQWAQCDNCCKWRKLPIDVFLPLKWTCADNIWDLSRYSAFSFFDQQKTGYINIYRKRETHTAKKSIQRVCCGKPRGEETKLEEKRREQKPTLPHTPTRRKFSRKVVGPTAIQVLV